MSGRRTVAIIGQGYVGLPLSLAAHEVGWSVIGIDSSTERVTEIKSGRSPIVDIESSDLKKALDEGFVASTDLSLVEKAEIVIICVPTPLNALGEPDLLPLQKAVSELAPYLQSGTLLINESTSYPGTVRSFIAKIVTEIRPNLEMLYAVAPERVDPGNPQWNHRNTPRLIAGLNAVAAEKAREFYASFCESVHVVSTPETAELAKLIENSFRQVNIALVNEIRTVASKVGVDIHEAIRAASTKPYGFMPFFPGLGVGGHCIPVDPMYLAWAARENGESISLIERAQEINKSIPERAAALIENLGLGKNEPILIVGLSYKRNIPDLRESPSVELIHLLRMKYENIQWWDACVEEYNSEKKSDLETSFTLVVITHVPDKEEVLKVIQNATHILDFTGQFVELPTIIRL